MNVVIYARYSSHAQSEASIEGQLKECHEFCKRNDLLISGGSDYHGKSKKDIELGIGKGNLEIPDEIIYNWEK